jgi:hypothetical protein
MAREEPTYRMRPEQRAELLKLTAPQSRRTSEMPRVELVSLLALDLDLAAAPVAIAGRGDFTDRIDMRMLWPDDTTRVTMPPSTLHLVIAFFAALLAGITITVPLW